MTAADLPPEQAVTLALEAISDRDPERLRSLLAPGVRILTGRAEHEGVDAALAWARTGYKHLDRRWRLDGLEPHGAGYVGRGRVEYVWREGGEVGDSSPVSFSVRFAERRLSHLGIHDTVDEARALLG